MSDISQFIVGIYQYDNKENQWSFIEDGFALISDKSYGPTLIIRSKEDQNDSKNVNYINIIISEDLDCEYKEYSPSLFSLFSEDLDCENKENTNNTGYTVTFKQNNQKIGIKFDQASSQSYQEFKSQLENKIATKYKTLYYDSGNLQYSGQFIDDELSGEGTEFYDTPDKQIKFFGEFEDDEYDGAGVFYSYDRKIEIKSNNISRGLPNGNIILIIHRKEKEDITKTLNYRLLDITFEPSDVNFCENIARQIHPDLDNLFFEACTIEEKMDEINRKLDMLLNDRTKEIIEIKRANRGYLQKLVGVLWNK